MNKQFLSIVMLVSTISLYGMNDEDNSQIDTQKIREEIAAAYCRAEKSGNIPTTLTDKQIEDACSHAQDMAANYKNPDYDDCLRRGFNIEAGISNSPVPQAQCQPNKK